MYEKGLKMPTEREITTVSLNEVSRNEVMNEILKDNPMVNPSGFLESLQGDQKIITKSNELFTPAPDQLINGGPI